MRRALLALSLMLLPSLAQAAPIELSFLGTVTSSARWATPGDPVLAMVLVPRHGRYDPPAGQSLMAIWDGGRFGTVHFEFLPPGLAVTRSREGITMLAERLALTWRFAVPRKGDALLPPLLGPMAEASFAYTDPEGTPISGTFRQVIVAPEPSLLGLLGTGVFAWRYRRGPRYR